MPYKNTFAGHFWFWRLGCSCMYTWTHYRSFCRYFPFFQDSVFACAQKQRAPAPRGKDLDQFSARICSENQWKTEHTVFFHSPVCSVHSDLLRRLMILWCVHFTSGVRAEKGIIRSWQRSSTRSWKNTRNQVGHEIGHFFVWNRFSETLSLI